MRCALLRLRCKTVNAAWTDKPFERHICVCKRGAFLILSRCLL